MKIDKKLQLQTSCYTLYKIPEKRSMFCNLKKKCAICWLYTSNVKQLIKYRVPEIKLLMFRYLFIAFDAYG